MKESDLRYNPDNEIVKYKFFECLEHTKDGKAPNTITQYANAIHEFEVANGFKDFKNYTSDWAIIFKDHLNDKKNKNTGDNISKSYYYNYISYVRQFFEWLVENETGYRKIKSKNIGYLHVTRNDKNKAKAKGHQDSHYVSDILSTIRNMPESTEIEMRDKAFISLLLLTTPRIDSIRTARIKSIRLFEEYDNTWAFTQDPRLQNIKYSKNITSFFIGQEKGIIQNVLRWRDYLISKGFKDKDFLFPKIAPNFTKEGNQIMALQKEAIKSCATLRNIVKKAFESNGIKYLKPHSFRHSVARKVRQTPNIDKTDILIALSENDGHQSGMATLISSYGDDYLARQAKIIKNIVLE